MNQKVMEIIEANDLDMDIIYEHINIYHKITKRTNKLGLSVGNNNRLRIRDRHAGGNYHHFLGFLKSPEFFEIRLNKNGHLNIFIKKGYQVHHKDGNKNNDTIENVEVLTEEAHYWADRKLLGGN